ncbi:restriction endonuclease subunit S [Prevotellamassilia timonensis]|uniref:restriction endonuclease subunit S n=1 Tax=Prevotellamassilia timonensis TaxID=1852370 RepID=UPI0030797AA2
MREGWEYKKLGEVCCPKNKIQRAARCFDSSDKILYIDISSIDNTMQKVTDITSVTFGDAPSRAQQKIEYGDIVVSTVRPNLKNIAIIDRYEPNIVASSGFCVLRNTECIERNYLFHYVTSDIFTQHLMKITTGANYPAVRDQDVRDSIIPLPPKSTQLAIVSELDKIKELIRLKKEQLKDFDNLAQSIFYEMFGDPVENDKGWEVMKLKEIVSDDCSISYGIVQPGDGVENGVPVVRPVDMTETFISRQGLKNTTKEISDSYKRTILKGDEILMCVRGTTGLVAMASPELKGCNVTRGITPIECGPSCNKWFIYYQISNPSIQQHIAEYTRGITLKQINMKDVREIPLCLPPLPLQHLFAQCIEQIEHQKAEVQKAIIDLETLLAARMQYWFE